MKRYVSATNYYDKKMTTEEVAEAFRTKYGLYGLYTTTRGKDYQYLIHTDGLVEVWYDYLKYDGPNRNHMKSKYLTAPKEMQQYLTEKYGEQLAELGIKLWF